jgi:hypothetical protein
MSDVTIRCHDEDIPYSWFLLSEVPFFAAAKPFAEGSNGVIHSTFPMKVMQCICAYIRFGDLPEINADLYSKEYVQQLLSAIDYYGLTDLLAAFKQICQERPTVATLTVFGKPDTRTFLRFVIWATEDLRRGINGSLKRITDPEIL